jgi:hypothetical protein
MKKIITLVFALTCFLTAGCVSPAVHKNVPQFANAVTLATQNSKAAFEIVDQKYVDISAGKLVIDYDANGFNPKNVHHLLKTEDLQVRLDVLTALQQYASTLSEVSSDSKLQEFDANTKALGTALQKITSEQPFKDLVSKASFDANIATTAVNAIGRWFIEKKRQKELPQLIAQMQEPVKRVAELLKADIGDRPGDDGTGGKGLRAVLWDAYMQSMIHQSTFINDNKSRLEPLVKAQEIRKLPQLVDERERADDALRHTAESLSRLVDAHEEILRAVRTKQDLHANISALISEGERIKEFYDSLQK